ncbi:integral membrane protein [Streptantibioticus cattleyicolor NRRL 8057 = DSM 46488]|uniref:Integral membrane protein n=1 Tax=Streptantibioticus cattleyicolor (strain ATCC 35852 / DSM 46488 / JCM 4925 / NBRC 14057 / NRRL 8057) TaxID=1003195 RepID=F8JSF3_STREN|nr:integral membrane protein [Streptantibioticus cattleyicolor NRRL 8057 = DSM 46488]CCB75814.1 Integral membrane protein [Streptantibioticus cattleyicolor NRRL 8057 = DSM 46488]
MTETRGPRPPQPHQQATGYAPPPQPGPAQQPDGPGGGSAAQAVRRPRPAARPLPRTRKARLRVAKADPWSVMKVSFLFSIALGICTIVAVAVLWLVLDALGVFTTVGGTISEATGSGQQSGFDLQSFLSFSNVMLVTVVIAVIDVVLLTALATLGSFIYNLTAGFTGGVELTLAEDE